MPAADTDPPYTDSQDEIGPVLLARARSAIARHLGLPTDVPPAPDWLSRRRATFVTLTRHGELRGCIGSVRAQRPLGDDVEANAVAAATRDPRFPPLSADEFADIQVEVSLLSEPEFIEFGDEAALAAQIQPGKHGVILFSGCRSATFLPQVWEQLPTPEAFLAALKQKAGLDPRRPAPKLMAATYTVQKWSEADSSREMARRSGGTPNEEKSR